MLKFFRNELEIRGNCLDSEDPLRFHLHFDFPTKEENIDLQNVRTVNSSSTKLFSFLPSHHDVEVARLLIRDSVPQAVAP